VLDGAEPSRDPIEIHSLIGSIADRYAPVASRKGLLLDIRTAQSVPPVVHGDRRGVEQALSDLIDNAVKFTDAGEIVASVTCEAAMGSRTILHVEVSDTGRGIPHPTLQRLFAVGGGPVAYAVDASEGGLIRSRRLVELMDGRFGASSEPGTGTTVWFTVPRDLTDR
jgi:signal transduction histidine kinase